MSTAAAASDRDERGDTARRESNCEDSPPVPAAGKIAGQPRTRTRKQRIRESGDSHDPAPTPGNIVDRTRVPRNRRSRSMESRPVSADAPDFAAVSEKQALVQRRNQTSVQESVDGLNQGRQEAGRDNDTQAPPLAHSIINWTLFLVAFLVVLLVYCLGCYPLPPPAPRCRGMELSSEWAELSNQLKSVIEGFELAVKCSTDFGSLRRGRVVQLEGTPANQETLEKLICVDFFPSEVFDRVVMDALVDTAIDPYFFEEFKQNRPLVVFIKNAHKATKRFMDSFIAFLGNEVYQGRVIQRKSYNVGFIFIGASLPEGAECQAINLHDHDAEILKWKSTIITRITQVIKVC